MPFKGNFSISFFSTFSLVDMDLLHDGDLAARIGLSGCCILARGADLVAVLKANMILATIRDQPATY